jgi:hypothetical protein
MVLRSFSLAVASFLLAACGASRLDCDTPSPESIVAVLQTDKQLRSMLTSAVNRTQTAGMITARDGAGGAAKISAAVDRAVERHKSEWQRNLVNAWSQLGPPELGEACQAIRGRDEIAYQNFLTRVGPEAQRLNEPLLRKASVEVLEESY